MKKYTKGWLRFGKIGLDYFRMFVEGLINFIMWIPCFILYPVLNRVINSKCFHKRKK